MTTAERTLNALNYIPSEVVCAQDYEQLASRFIPPDRFAYLSGGSGHDLTLQNNRHIYSDFSLIPRVLRDVSNGNTQIECLGKVMKHPVLLAPVAYQTLAHPEGELATAYAAESTDTCMVASTLSSFTLEQIAENAGQQRWFQLYFQPNDDDTFSLIKRAIQAGYKAIVVTVDAAVQTPSIRAIREGFSFPKDVVPANIINQQAVEPAVPDADQSRIFLNYMHHAPTQEKLKRLIAQSSVPVLIKGVLHPDDARELKALGAAGIIVSNHGGRTIDSAPASLAVLPSIRQAVGDDYPVLLDSGIRSGSDIFKAIALGADAVLIGRLQVYALSVAGALGVAHMIKLLREELELTMAMTGCSSIADIKKTELYRNLARSS